MKFIINSKDIRKLFDERFGEVSVTNIKQTSLLKQENIFFCFGITIFFEYTQTTACLVRSVRESESHDMTH